MSWNKKEETVLLSDALYVEDPVRFCFRACQPLLGVNIPSPWKDESHFLCCSEGVRWCMKSAYRLRMIFMIPLSSDSSVLSIKTDNRKFLFLIKVSLYLTVAIGFYHSFIMIVGFSRASDNIIYTALAFCCPLPVSHGPQPFTHAKIFTLEQWQVTATTSEISWQGVDVWNWLWTMCFL